jgi:hypothetical protein
LRRDAATAALAVLVAGCSSAEPGQTPLGTAQEELGAAAGSEYNPLPGHLPTKDRFAHELSGFRNRNTLSNHGGPTLTAAHVVACFWGPAWATSSNGNISEAGLEMAQSLQSFIGRFGTSGEYSVITQYSSITNSALATHTWTDTSTPPTNVTDTLVQAEASKCMAATGGYDSSAIYEVFLANGVYSSNGTSTSCDGPNLQYCAYHGYFSQNGENIKYASMPYPSCGGCQSAGFTHTQDFEHFISHETREAVTDANLNAWYDRNGNEADDKCAWSPAPFTDCSNGTNFDNSCFAYQYEWSNASSSCVQKM